MKKDRSKLLFTILTVVMLLSIIATFYRYVVMRDFVAIDDTQEEIEE